MSHLNSAGAPPYLGEPGVRWRQQYLRGRATGGGTATDGPQRGAARILPSPPNEKAPRYSQAVAPGRVCVHVRVCACVHWDMRGRHVFASSHLSNSEDLAREEAAIMEDGTTDGVVFTCETV